MQSVLQAGHCYGQLGFQPLGTTGCGVDVPQGCALHLQGEEAGVFIYQLPICPWLRRPLGL